MFLISYRAKVNPKSKRASEYKDCGGAYVNCWISYKDFDGAEQLARFYIRQAGWIPEIKTDESTIRKSDCKKKKEKQYYAEAMKDGYTLVFHLWPKDAEDADYDYEAESSPAHQH